MMANLHRSNPLRPQTERLSPVFPSIGSSSLLCNKYHPKSPLLWLCDKRRKDSGYFRHIQEELSYPAFLLSFSFIPNPRNPPPFLSNPPTPRNQPLLADRALPFILIHLSPNTTPNARSLPHPALPGHVKSLPTPKSLFSHLPVRCASVIWIPNRMPTAERHNRIVRVQF